MIRNRVLDPSSNARGLLYLARQVLGAGSPSVAEQHTEHYAGASKPFFLCDELLGWVDRHRWWFWSVMLLMYAAGFNGQWRIQPDAALYLSIGRNLAEGKGYTYLGQANHLAYPGWPGLIAVAFKVFGTQSLVPVNAMATVIALLTVAVVYRLFLLHCGRPTAVVVSVGVGLTKAFYCYGFELWADMPFALGAMGFLAGYEGISTGPDRTLSRGKRVLRRGIDLVFLIGGMLVALSTRPTVWPLLLAMGCALPIDAMRGRIRWRSLFVILGFVLLVGGTMFLGRHDFGTIYGQYLLQRLTDSPGSDLVASVLRNMGSLLTWAASDVLFQVRLGRWCNALLSIVVLLLGFGLFRYRSLWGFWFCLLLGTILVSQATLDRYFLPVLPLLVFAWWDALVRINRTLPSRWGNLVFLGLLGFGTLMNFTKVCGIIAQQHTRPFLSRYDSGQYEVVPEFSRKLTDRVEPNAIVLICSPYGRVTAFLSTRTVESAVEAPLLQAGQQPIYVVEPLDFATVKFLHDAHLTEGPALFTVTPSPACGLKGIALSLHSTLPAR